MRYLIIGNGVAGVEAALAIRQNDPDGTVTILSGSKYPFYYRPRLIDFIKENLPAEKLFAYPEQFWNEKKIEVKLNTFAERINPGEQKVLDSKGEVYLYDRLLLAIGADPIIPEIANSNVEGVFTLRGIDSAERILAYCRGKENLVIAGGGLLGIETAHALTPYCEKITVIDVALNLLPRQLDGEGASCLQQILENRGLRFIFRESVKKIEGNGKVERLVLSSGLSLPADVFLVTAGVKARIDIARSSGLEVNSGIKIDDYMKTSAENIFAAGDCAEHNGRCYGLWMVSKEHGRIAGLNMSGEQNIYVGSIPSASLKVTGVDVFSSGDFSSEGDNIMKLDESGKYAKIIYNNDIPIGAVVVGDNSVIREARKAMSGKGNVDELKKALGY